MIYLRSCLPVDHPKSTYLLRNWDGVPEEFGEFADKKSKHDSGDLRCQ